MNSSRHPDSSRGLVEMRVLTIGAHPDDLEQLCGGTIACYVRGGHDVVMCHVTSGDKGSFAHDAHEIARIRDSEARRAASIVRASYRAFGLGDGEVSAADPRQREMMVELIRDVVPDMIITHYPRDYMCDHNETSKLVFDASFLASVPLYGSTVPTPPDRIAKVTPLFYMETVGGAGFTPTEYVDISEVIDTKSEMLASHQSQHTWLEEHDGVDIVDQMRTMARYRGYQCGVRYAEGFVQALEWLRPVTRRLLP